MHVKKMKQLEQNQNGTIGTKREKIEEKKMRMRIRIYLHEREEKEKKEVRMCVSLREKNVRRE